MLIIYNVIRSDILFDYFDIKLKQGFDSCDFFYADKRVVKDLKGIKGVRI